jgi:hypothetical protein
MKFNDSYSFFQEMSYSNITNWTRPYTFNVSEIPVVDIYTGNKEQYGGNRISALSNREYIQCSDLNNISDGDVVQVFNGDIFITYMHYLNATNIGKDITANDPYHG